MRSHAIKKWWFVAAFLSGLALAMWAEDLILNWRENRLEFTAPRVHFLGGKSLERLHNGASVPFNFQVTLWSGNRNHVYLKIPEQFVISYDLWEESFKVVQTQGARKAIAHLTAQAAERWCLDQMSAPLTGLGDKELLWARVEIRAEDGKDGRPLFNKDIPPSGISLTGLIEIFSRPPAKEQSHWTLDAGPQTIEELKSSRRRF